MIMLTIVIVLIGRILNALHILTNLILIKLGFLPDFKDK